MSKSIAKAGRREPAFRGKKRVANLWQRRLADGTLVFDFAGRLHRGAKPTMRRLEAKTVADAIVELAELRVDAGRGKVAPADRRLSVRDLIVKYVEHAEPRLAPGTFKLYKFRLGFAERELGSYRAADVDLRAIRTYAARLADGRIKGKGGAASGWRRSRRPVV